MTSVYMNKEELNMVMSCLYYCSLEIMNDGFEEVQELTPEAKDKFIKKVEQFIWRVEIG